MDLELRVAKDFLRLFRGIGKTRSMVENIMAFCEEQKLFRKEFKVAVIVESKDLGFFLEQKLRYFEEHVEIITMPTILYALSNMPKTDDCSIQTLLFRLKPSYRFEKVFIDPGCFESLCEQQLAKLSKILKVVGGEE